MPGTNFNTKINDFINISLTDENNKATDVECNGDPSAFATEAGIYTNGCILRRTDIGSGVALYQNTGSISSPTWTAITGGGGGGAFSSITGTPTTIAYFDALGLGTGDLDHTLLADGTLRLTSTFGDVTGNYFQLLNPGVGNVGTWGVSAANNVTNSNFVQIIVDGTNIPDVGNDTAFLTSAQFPNTGVEYTELIASQGWVMGVAGDTWQGNQQLLSTGWEMNFDDGTSGGKLQIITGGIGITATDLSSSTTGYSVDAAFSSIFADDSGTSVRVATGKDIVDYVQDGSIISSTTFSGGGLNDLTPGGSYTGAYTGNYTITVIGNNGARVVFNGGMTTGDQFAVGEIVTGSISGATAVVSNGTNDTRIWVYDVTGTGFVNGDILIGDQGNVSTAVTTAGNAPGVGDLFEVNYTDFTYTQVQWFTGNQAYGTAFNGIGGITYELVTSPTGHTPNDEWAFTSSALYEERYKANGTTVSTGDTADQSTATKQIIDIPNQTISGWSDGTNKTILVGKTLSLPDNTDTGVFEVALPAGGMTGGYFTVTIIATDGTDFQAHSDHVTYAAVNKGGVYTTAIQNSNGDDAIANSAGTLAVTWTIVTGANKITITVNANSSLAGATITLAGLNIDNNNGHVVTIL